MGAPAWYFASRDGSVAAKRRRCRKRNLRQPKRWILVDNPFVSRLLPLATVNRRTNHYLLSFHHQLWGAANRSLPTTRSSISCHGLGFNGSGFFAVASVGEAK